MTLTILILVSWQHTGNCGKLPTRSSAASEMSVVSPAKSKQWQLSLLPYFSLLSIHFSHPLTAQFYLFGGDGKAGRGFFGDSLGKVVSNL